MLAFHPADGFYHPADSIAARFRGVHHVEGHPLLLVIAKGYRLRPRRSPSLRRCLATLCGADAADPDARKSFGLIWRERIHMERFLKGVADCRRAQRLLPRSCTDSF
jgi:hypothetical protein